MATTTFTPGNAAATTLTGTSADDTVNIDVTGLAGSNTHIVAIGAGTDTIVFDGELAAGAGAGVFSAAATNSFLFGTTDGTFNVGGFEFLTFDNGTVSSAASVTPEQLLGDAISGEISALGDDANASAAPNDFDLSTVFDWDGSSINPVTASDSWTIQSIEGQSTIANTNISIVEGGVIQGRATVNAANDGIDVTAENAFHTSITEIGGRETMEIDVVLENAAGDTFEETLSVDVVGVASNADNTFAGTAGDDTVDGLAGDDTLRGDAGDDVIFGNDGDDVMFAGPNDAGDDVLVGGAGDDILGGGAGDDILVGNSHVGDTGALGAATAVSAVSGTPAATALGEATDDGANRIFGGAGDDVIAVGGYNDVTTDLAAGNTAGATIAEFTGTMGGTAFAGKGDDEVYGSASGDDIIGLGDGDDVVLTFNGDNTVFGAAGMDSITTGAGSNTIFGGADDDTIDSNGTDEIFGGAGDDVIANLAGDTTIDGGAGDDAMTGLLGAVDTFVFEAGDGTDAIATFTQGEDLLDVSALGVSSIDELFVATDGTSTTILFEDGSVELTGIATALTDADFIF